MRCFKKGMSIIEMLAVIAIIFVIIGIGGYTWINGQQKARDGRRKSDLVEVQKALEFYLEDNSKYPRGSGSIACNLGTDSTDKVWGEEFSCDPDGAGGPAQKTVYMKRLPQDPTGEASYYYDSGGGSSYKIGAKLENTRDPEYCEEACIANGKLACEPPAGMTYCVTNP